MDNILDNILHTHLNHYASSNDEIIQRASSKGLMLTDEHWKVIDFVSDIYKHAGFETPSSRQLRSQLKTNFKNQGGNRYLYQLFPDGPIDSITFLAGFPLH